MFEVDIQKMMELRRRRINGTHNGFDLRLGLTTDLKFVNKHFRQLLAWHHYY